MAARDREAGMSLVELVIAVFLLALLAVAVLPLLASTAVLSARNTSDNEATQYATSLVSQLRAQFPDAANATTTCANLGTAATSLPASDPRTDMAAAITVTCPESAADASAVTYPAAVPVTVVVTDSSDGSELATLTTQLYVAGP